MKKFYDFCSKHLEIIVLIGLIIVLFFFLLLTSLKNYNSEKDFEFNQITGTYYIENNFLNNNILNYLCASSDTAPDYSIALDDENKIRYAFAYIKNQTNASEIDYADFLTTYYDLFDENISENIFVEAVMIEGYRYDAMEEKFIPDDTLTSDEPIINNLLQDCKLVSSNLEKTKVNNNDILYTLTSDIVKAESDELQPSEPTEPFEDINEEVEENVVGNISISLQLVDDQLVIRDFHIDFGNNDK